MYFPPSPPLDPGELWRWRLRAWARRLAVRERVGVQREGTRVWPQTLSCSRGVQPGLVGQGAIPSDRFCFAFFQTSLKSHVKKNGGPLFPGRLSLLLQCPLTCVTAWALPSVPGHRGPVQGAWGHKRGRRASAAGGRAGGTRGRWGPGAVGTAAHAPCRAAMPSPALAGARRHGDGLRLVLGAARLRGFSSRERGTRAARASLFCSRESQHRRSRFRARNPVPRRALLPFVPGA